MNQPANQVTIIKLGLERMFGDQRVLVMTFTEVKKQNQGIFFNSEKRQMKEAVDQMSIRSMTFKKIKYRSNPKGPPNLYHLSSVWSMPLKEHRMLTPESVHHQLNTQCVFLQTEKRRVGEAGSPSPRELGHIAPTQREGDSQPPSVFPRSPVTWPFLKRSSVWSYADAQT